MAKIWYHTLVVLVLCLIWVLVSQYQDSRYVVDVYDCSDMSKDCEQVFERLGFHTQIAHGVQRDGNGNITVYHCWLIVHIRGYLVEFESTSLYFGPVSPDYEVRQIVEGWYSGRNEIL